VNDLYFELDFESKRWKGSQDVLPVLLLIQFDGSFGLLFD
jgi:hypothetical protein